MRESHRGTCWVGQVAPFWFEHYPLLLCSHGQVPATLRLCSILWKTREPPLLSLFHGWRLGLRGRRRKRGGEGPVKQKRGPAGEDVMDKAG